MTKGKIMAETITGNFAANGDSDEFVFDRATFLLGTVTNGNFGGGTVTFYVRHNDQLDWTADSTYTASGTKTTEEIAGGMRGKLTLSGATSPNLDYTIKYD